MVYLAQNKNKICPLKEIAKKENISFDYLEKIISKLKNAGLVKSLKGSRGGYFLALDPKKIKIGQIISVLEGKNNFVKCLAKNKKEACLLEKKCLTKNFWKKIQDSLKKSLDSITLADLID